MGEGAFDTAWVWDHGTIRPAREVRISPFDRGFTLGDGAFETIRVTQGKPRRVAAHIARLDETLNALRLALTLEPGTIAEAIAVLAATAKQPEAIARLTVTRGEGARGLAPPEDAAPRALITLAPPPPTLPPAHLALASGRRPVGPPGLKVTSYAHNVMALLEAREAGGDEALVLDTQGHVSSAASANLFWVMRDGALLTPALATGCRDGVTRATILRLARQEGLNVQSVRQLAGYLGQAEALFMTNTAIGVRAVSAVSWTSVDGHPVRYRFDTSHPVVQHLAALERADDEDLDESTGESTKPNTV